MAKKFYTFISVPNSGSQLHKLRVPARAIYLLATTGFLLFVAAAALGFSYAKMAFMVSDYTTIQSENRELRVQKRNLEISTQRLNSKLATLETLAERLTDLIEKDSWTQQFAKSHLAGIGGSRVDYTTEDLIGGSAVKSDVESLKDRTADLEGQLNLVEHLAEWRADLIRSTPTIWPVRGRISSHYGNRKDPFTGDAELHLGVDIAGLYGGAVRAPADGLVIYAQRKWAYGNLVVLSHGKGVTTRHGHLSRFAVRAGQSVAKGEIIGYVGSTGRTTAPHLHYEVRINDRPVNPRNYLPRGE